MFCPKIRGDTLFWVLQMYLFFADIANKKYKKNYKIMKFSLQSWSVLKILIIFVENYVNP